MRLFIAILICFACASAQAVTNTAASASLAAVTTAMGLCNDGDVLQIPTGTVTWSGPLDMNKAIWLKGNGTNNTKIATATGVNAVNYSGGTGKARISHIFFDLGAFSRSDHTAISLEATNKQFRIDNCRFRGGSKVIFTRGSLNYGVVDHCHFLDSDGEIYPWLRLANLGAESWLLEIKPGTTNAMVVEDCWFQRTSAVNGELTDETLYGQEGARCMFRFNHFQQDTTDTAAYMVDAHGNLPGGAGRGTVLYEIYGNKWDCVTTDRGFNLRGGIMICYSNDFTGSIGTMFQLKNEGVSTAGVFDGQDRMTNSHFYANKLNGVTTTGIEIENYSGHDSTPYVVLGTHYHTHPIVSTNNFYPYTRLTYPHPLVTYWDGSDNPTISVTPTSVDVTAAQGGATNVTITVMNTGGGTLTGVAALAVTNPWTISGAGTSYSLGAGLSTTFTLTFSSTNVYSQGTLTFTGGGGTSVPLLGGYTKTYVQPLGDSLTRGGSSTGPNFVLGGYRDVLYTLLTNRGVNCVYVGNTSSNAGTVNPYPLHDGYGGIEVGELATNYSTYASGLTYAPDWVLMQSEINDARHNNDLQNMTNRLKMLIDAVTTNYPAAKLIVTAMNPWQGLAATNNSLDLLYHPYVAAIVATKFAAGKLVYFCDMRTNSLTAIPILHTDVMFDETHFETNGYRKMATNWFNVMSPVAAPGNLTILGKTAKGKL